MRIVTNQFRAVASACWRMHPRSTCMNNVGDLLPNVIWFTCSRTTTTCTASKTITTSMRHDHQIQQQRRRQVWNASYENDKEANDIVQTIQQLKAKIMDPTSDDHQDVDTQRQISKLKQDYQRVTGEEYNDDDDDSDESLPNRVTTPLGHPSNHDKTSK